MLKRFFFFYSMLILLSVHTAFAWQLEIAKQAPIANGKANFYQFKASRTLSFPILVDAILLNNNKYKAGLYVQPQDNVQSVLDIATQKKAFLATNGGYYREEFLVNGLLIDQNKLRLPLVNNALLSSVISIDQKGQINILDKNQPYKNPYYAFQVGPILIKNNVVQKVSDEKVAKRIIYAQTKTQLLVIYLDSASLQQTAKIVKLIAKKLKLIMIRAVNFDGGKAGAFVVRKYITPLIHPEYAPVKSIVYFSLTDHP